MTDPVYLDFGIGCAKYQLDTRDSPLVAWAKRLRALDNALDILRGRATDLLATRDEEQLRVVTGATTTIADTWRASGHSVGDTASLHRVLGSQADYLRKGYCDYSPRIAGELVALALKIEQSLTTNGACICICPTADSGRLRVYLSVPEAAVRLLEDRYLPDMVADKTLLYALRFNSASDMMAWSEVRSSSMQEPWACYAPNTGATRSYLADIYRTGETESYAALREYVANWCTGLPAC